jgi:DNA-binding XRE family transcriptional regulator
VFHVKQISSLHRNMEPGYVAEMVTRIHKGVKRRLFLKEHRKAKQMTAETMGGRLGLERESVHRLERYPERVTWEKQCAYAEALDIEPEELWQRPGTPSLDALARAAPEETRAMAVEMAADILRRMAGGKG